MIAGLLIRALIVALGLWLASLIVPGIHVYSLASLVAAAVILGVLNAVVRPVLVLLTLPLTLLTLGLFLLVINAALLGLVGWLLNGFDVDGFWPALFGSIVVSVVSWVCTRFIGERR
jgi:putative membrane protein